MKDLIKSYEQQFGNLSADGTAKIGELARLGRESPDDTAGLGQLRTTIGDILAEARDVLEQFELEVRETPKESK